MMSRAYKSLATVLPVPPPVLAINFIPLFLKKNFYGRTKFI